VKFGPVVLADSGEQANGNCNALRVYIVVWRILSNISGFSGPIFTIFSLYIKVLCMLMMDLYLTFQFVKGRCHGNQVMFA